MINMLYCAVASCIENTIYNQMNLYPRGGHSVYFMISLDDDDTSFDNVHKIIRPLFEKYYDYIPYCTSLIEIIPASKADEIRLRCSSKIIIYKDSFFNTWKLESYPFPNRFIIDLFRYSYINIFSIPTENINIVKKFIMNKFLYPEEKIKLLPYLSVTKNNDIEIYDIIHNSKSDVMNIIVFPKTFTISNVLMILKTIDSAVNVKFFINDNSNQLYEIILDHDAVVYRKC